MLLGCCLCAHPIPTRYIPAIVWEGFAGGCRPWRGGWGSYDNDNDPRGNDDVDNVQLCPPRPHNNKPFGQGEGGPFGQGEGGGAATVDAILQGQVGDAAKEEKIRTTATEKEKEWVRARATRSLAGNIADMSRHVGST